VDAKPVSHPSALTPCRLAYSFIHKDMIHEQIGILSGPHNVISCNTDPLITAQW